MAFSRVVQLTVGANGTGLAFDNLHIDFRIEKSRKVSSNFSEYTIYNAQESTRKNVLKKGNNLIFNAGYLDEAIATLFVGNIVKAYSQKIGNNWVTKVRANSIVAKDQKLDIIPIATSFAPDTVISKPLDIIAQASGLLLSGIENVSTIKMPNGFVYAGTYGGALRYIKEILISNNVGMYIDNNEIVLYKIGNPSRYKTVFLNYNAGLLSVTDITKAEEDKKRIEFNTIMIPQIRVNGVISIKGTSTEDGSYIVDEFVAEGNNYGGKFNISGEATV